MIKLTLKSICQSDCTVGVLSVHENAKRIFRCVTLELPYLNNQPNVSCIPSGVYPCFMVHSPKFGECIAVEGVNGRSLIRIHQGNYTSQIEGCILVGDSIKDINNDGILDVTNSVNTLNKLLAKLPDKFELEVSRLY